MKKKKNKNIKEQDWLDPKNDRKTPYPEEELDIFVDGLIDNMKDVKSMNTTLHLPLTNHNLLPGPDKQNFFYVFKPLKKLSFFLRYFLQ